MPDEATDVRITLEQFSGDLRERVWTDVLVAGDRLAARVVAYQVLHVGEEMPDGRGPRLEALMNAYRSLMPDDEREVFDAWRARTLDGEGESALILGVMKAVADATDAFLAGKPAKEDN